MTIIAIHVNVVKQIIIISLFLSLALSLSHSSAFDNNLFETDQH